jgi:hypothetical protein
LKLGSQTRESDDPEVHVLSELEGAPETHAQVMNVPSYSIDSLDYVSTGEVKARGTGDVIYLAFTSAGTCHLEFRAGGF